MVSRGSTLLQTKCHAMVCTDIRQVDTGRETTIGDAHSLRVAKYPAPR